MLNKLNLVSIFSFSGLITSNYYFYSARGIFINYENIFFQTLYLFVFSVIFFSLISIYFRNIEQKIKIISKISAFLILTWLIKETLNGYILISNTYSFGQLFVLVSKNFFKSEYLNLIIERALPYMISAFICYICFNKTEKLLRFIKISGLIFVTYFIYEFSTRYIESQKNFENKNYQIISSHNSQKRVIWIIFDEFDYKYAEEYNLISKSRVLSNSSVSSRNALPPGPNTMISLPATLMNLYPNGSGSEDFYYLINSDGEKVQFKYENTLFKRLDERNQKYQIFSSMLTYCSMLNIKENCSEKLGQWYRGIIFEYSFFNKFKTFYFYTRNFFSKSSEQISLKEILNAEIKKTILETDSIDGHNNFSYLDFKNSLNAQNNFILMHLYLPHLPAQYAMDKYKIYLNEEDHLKQYFLNIKLSDIVIDKLYKLIKENSDENTLLIFSSDHWYRFGPDRKRSNDDNKTAYPVLFISKILSDASKFTIEKKINLNLIHDLILRYFDNNLNTNKEIYDFLRDQQFTEPFLNTIYR